MPSWSVVIGILVVAAQFATGVRGLVRNFEVVFRSAPYDVVSPALRARIDDVRQRLPPGSGLLYVMREPEYWQSRQWHRMLYPIPVFFAEGATQLERSDLRASLARYNVRYAVSVGAPPLDAGFRWQVLLAPAAGLPETWFGELP